MASTFVSTDSLSSTEDNYYPNKEQKLLGLNIWLHWYTCPIFLPFFKKGTTSPISPPSPLGSSCPGLLNVKVEIYSNGKLFLYQHQHFAYVWVLQRISFDETKPYHCETCLKFFLLSILSLGIPT